MFFFSSLNHAFKSIFLLASFTTFLSSVTILPSVFFDQGDSLNKLYVHNICTNKHNFQHFKSLKHYVLYMSVTILTGFWKIFTCIFNQLLDSWLNNFFSFFSPHDQAG